MDVKSEAREPDAGYSLAVLRRGELAALVPLLRRTFSRRYFTGDWLTRKYAFEHNGTGAFACAAFSEHGEPVAVLGVLPFPVRHGDRIEVAGQLVDGATASDHRRRGLFARLADLAFEECSALGMSFLFGFAHPEGDSYPALVGRLGYEHIDDLVEYRLPVLTLPAELAMGRAPGVRSLYAAYANKFLEDRASTDPVLPNSLVVNGFAGVERTGALLAYKAAFGGSRVISVGGGRAWVKVSRGLFVGDIEAASEETVDQTLTALQSIARRLGTHRLVFQASRESRFSRLFGTRVPIRPSLAVVYRNVDSLIPTKDLRFTLGDLDNF